MITDWSLLRKQKHALLKIVETGVLKKCNEHAVFSKGRRIGNMVFVSTRDAGLLNGLVHMVDGIQDSAVDRDGVSERKVFGKLNHHIGSRVTKASILRGRK